MGWQYFLVGEKTEKLISKLRKDFKIKDLSIAQHILGMKIGYIGENKTIVNQEHIRNQVEGYSLQDWKDNQDTYAFKCQTHQFHTQGGGKVQSKRIVLSQSAIESLKYLSQRPDITYSVGNIS